MNMHLQGPSLRVNMMDRSSPGVFYIALRSFACDYIKEYNQESKVFVYIEVPFLMSILRIDFTS